MVIETHHGNERTLRRYLVFAILACFGCVGTPPGLPNAETDADVVADVGSIADAESGDDASTADADSAGQDSGDQDPVDVGFDDAGTDGGTAVVYASPVDVTDVWYFENSLASADSNRTFGGAQTPNYVEGIGGTRALDLALGEVYTLDDTDTGFPRPGGSFTVGAWLQDFDANESTILGFRGPQDGGWALTYDGTRFSCVAFDALGDPQAASFALEIDSNIWHHVACKYTLGQTSVEVDITIFVNGDAGQPSNGVGYLAPMPSTAQMAIGSTSLAATDSEFRGKLDELFFSTRPEFDEMDIAKVWACGVSGRGCTCNPAGLVEYESCARGDDCQKLAPCTER
jgi:hypothetical protein